jgi:hypothetical protein
MQAGVLCCDVGCDKHASCGQHHGDARWGLAGGIRYNHAHVTAASHYGYQSQMG